MVKILGICGSPRKESTYYSLNEALKSAEKIEGVETELIELRGKKITSCIGCNTCVNKNINNCLIYKDDMNEIYEKFFEADAFIIASPVYGMGITSQLSTFFSRFRPDYLLQRDERDAHLFKFGAALAVGGTRNGGQESTINAIHGFYHTCGVTVANGAIGVYGGACVWSKDKKAQGAEEDLIGMENARVLGERLAKLTVTMKKGLEA